MFGKKNKQKFKIIAVFEELDDVSRMLEEFMIEYGYKANRASRLEINNPSEYIILHVDPNNLPDMRDFQIESIVLNLKSPSIYYKEVLKIAKKLDKNGSIVGDKKAFEKIEKKVSKNILLAKIDYSAQDETRQTHTFKNIAFHAESLTRSMYRYADKDTEADKLWSIQNKYAYKLEALLFATVNSCGLIS